jgi:hypothetical protein
MLAVEFPSPCDGSGSACRSIFGGVGAGEDPEPFEGMQSLAGQTVHKQTETVQIGLIIEPQRRENHSQGVDIVSLSPICSSWEFAARRLMCAHLRGSEQRFSSPSNVDAAEEGSIS